MSEEVANDVVPIYSDSIFQPLSPLFMLKKPFGLINGSWPPLCSAEATSLSLHINATFTSSSVQFQSNA